MFILCTLRHASNRINNLEFEEHPEGMITVEEVSQEVADYFSKIEGFSAVKDKKVKTPKAPAKTAEELEAEAAAEKAAQEAAAESAAAEQSAAEKAAKAPAKK